MAASDFSRARWRTSSRSGSSGGQCVEVAHQPHAVGIRDSKHSDGPMLVLGPARWAAFLRSLRH
ncbi:MULTISPECIES: DUF397 domain-containing protein [Actinoalloteichus]|uniref:DUF397 family protein n=1 Tax=Actinoalloteichus fjordicus TaxID=1612552 RepID=A0AAC9LIK5_9PSEU|nr:MULTISPECIES: DUF397 domain-containing protein [Actinoalloteichus]APU17005.1 putative DUF397 family protein [Actinoalloteichus fjordicus]APU23085.1 putative DUF397 family protein [Actinoalloteichus sp. GBA129-24]